MEVNIDSYQDKLINTNKDFDLIDDLCKECLQYLNTVDSKLNTNPQTDRDELRINAEETKVLIHMDNDYNITLDKFIDDDDIEDCGKDDTSTEKEINQKKNKLIVQSNTDQSEFEKCVQDEEENNMEMIDIDQEYEEIRSSRLRKLSRQLPKIIITNTDGSNSFKKFGDTIVDDENSQKWIKDTKLCTSSRRFYSKRRITKKGVENVALISNIPYEKIRLLNDAFHTLINLRWRWIVLGTVVVHFSIWLVFAVLWYIAALAHEDLGPDPPAKRCVTGGKDFLNIFLASVEAQTTIGFGDRTIDEECPESIFLFIMQLIMGTGLSGVLTCVVYAKLTRPENFAKEGVGFSRNAAVCLRDGQLCLIFRVWDLNYDHMIGSEIHAYFIKTVRTKEGEVLKHYAATLPLLQRQLMLWPITAVHVIDSDSALYDMTPEDFMNSQYEIAISLKGASASMGTYTQSQTSYLPREVKWGYRFNSVIKYNSHEQKYTIDHPNLNTLQEVETPLCSARMLADAMPSKSCSSSGTHCSFTERVGSLRKERPTSFSWRTETSV